MCTDIQSVDKINAIVDLGWSTTGELTLNAVLVDTRNIGTDFAKNITHMLSITLLLCLAVYYQIFLG